MNPKKGKNPILILLLYVIAILISNTGYAQEYALYGGELKYGENEFPDSFDPITSTLNMPNVRLMELLFESLLVTDELGNYVPQLSEGMPVISGTEVIFNLKQNVTWHDGQPFTSADVKFTYDLIKNNRTVKEPYLKALIDYFQGCSVLGPYQVKFTLKQALPEPYYLFTFKIVPKHAIGKDYLQKTDPFVRNPIGTGPFKFVGNVENTIKLQAQDPYHGDGGRAFLDRIKMEYIADPQAMYTSLKFGGLDAIVEIRFKDISDLKSTNKFNIREYNSLSFSYIGYNFRNPILKIKKVRQAMSLGIDRAQILKVYHLNKGILISGPFPPAGPWTNPDIHPWPFKPDLAKELLMDINCTDLNGDGILELNNQPLEFTLIIEKEGKNVEEVAQAIKDYLKDIGIRINIKHMDSQAILSTVFRNKNFDMIISGWVFDAANDVSSLFRTDGYNNFISYSNSDVDKLIDFISNTTDSERRRLANYKLHEILALECPYTFLWTLHKYAAIHKKVRGTEKIHPFKFFTFITDWYIPRTEQ